MSIETNLSDGTNNQKSDEHSPQTISKKSLLNTDREYIEKFIKGKQIIDQQNPFKPSSSKKPWSSASLPTKISHTEKQEEEAKADYKNSIQKSSSSDDLITTEEVLRQSKYVKTYIKNPDPYFVYDPAILARIKEEEEKEKQNKINRGLTKSPIIKKRTPTKSTPLKLSHKKCSKPNYPNLKDIKVKVGTDLEGGSYLNPNEIKTNVKKFDERVKKINFNYDEDSEDMEEQRIRTSSNSSEEEETIKSSNVSEICQSDGIQSTENNSEFYIKASDFRDNENNYNEISRNETLPTVNVDNVGEGSFTNTISSKEFRKYLKKKGLVLTPKQPQSNCIKVTQTNGLISKPNERNLSKPSLLEMPITKLSNRRGCNKNDNEPNLNETPKKIKKSSIFQRLLANNIFFARRKTALKEEAVVHKIRHQKINDVGCGITNANARKQEEVLRHKRILLENVTKRSKSACLESNYITNTLQDGKIDEEISKQYLLENCYDHYDRPNDIEHLEKTNPQNVDNKILTNRNEMLKHRKILDGSSETYADITRKQPISPSQFTRTSVLRQRQQQPLPLTSTPLRPLSSSTTDSRISKANCTSSSTLTSSICEFETQPSAVGFTKNEFPSLRVQQKQQQQRYQKQQQQHQQQRQQQRSQQQITDRRDLYTIVLQRKLRNNENLYERLPTQQQQQQQHKLINSISIAKPAEYSAAASAASDWVQPIYSSPIQSRCQSFVRGDLQRNTFCGVNRDPNYCINSINIIPVSEKQRQQTQSEGNFQLHHSTNSSIERNQPSRLSCRSNLSREEVLDKVRQFCRNSMRRQSEQTMQENAIDPKRLSCSEISAEVSCDSLATASTTASHHFISQYRRPGPQVPSRGSQNLTARQQLLMAPLSPPNSATEARLSINSEDIYQGGSIKIIESQECPILERKTNNLRLVQEGQKTTTKYWSGQTPNRSEKKFMDPGKTLQHFPNERSGTPLILESSSNLKSQIYSPQKKSCVTLRNLKDNLLRKPNLRHGQYFSSSLNFYTKNDHKQQITQKGVSQNPQFSTETGAGMGQLNVREEDWQNENKSGRQQTNEQVNDERRRSSRREDPRRHTLGGDMLQYGVMQGQPQQRAMDLESQPVRSYAPVSQGPLFDEDPGIMSEVETASTGFRRGGKQRSSLPVVRTPSKTLERPLGLVFLQYRSETKRALLPNEITSIDTVRALFVRSFPRQLTMSYLEGPNVKIYIHDASKDMFYELEDVRSHLREIRDRSVLRLFESTEVAAAPPQVLPGGPGIPQPLPQAVPIQWDQDQSYFSEPEFDSEYQHQHIHKSKPGKQPPYYVGSSQTLPRGMYSDRNKVTMGAPAKPLRSYGSRGNMGPIFPYPPDQLYSIPDGYTSSPERGTRGSYEEPYYSQYGTRGNVVTPIIDEENSEIAITEDQYALYGMKIGPGRIPRTANQMYDPTRPEDLHRIRVEHMERQLANLTGLVQKALVNQNPQIVPAAVPILNANYLGAPAASQCRADKSVSFEKSVSFSDDIQGVPKSHSPQHAGNTFSHKITAV